MFKITNVTNGDTAETDTAEGAYLAYRQLKRDAPVQPRIKIVNLDTGKLVSQDGVTQIAPVS